MRVKHRFLPGRAFRFLDRSYDTILFRRRSRRPDVLGICPIFQTGQVSSAKVRIPMPNVCQCICVCDVNDARDSDVERVVIMTPVVTRIICARVYLANEISIMIQPKNMPRSFEGLTLQQICALQQLNPTYLLFDTNHPMNMLTSPPLLII